MKRFILFTALIFTSVFMLKAQSDFYLQQLITTEMNQGI